MARRSLVAGAAAVAAAGVLAESSSAVASASDRLVDVHAHFVPSVYLRRAKALGASPDGMPDWPSWSEAGHLALMDLAGIDVSVLSLSSPGVHLGTGAEAVSLARAVNDEAAAVVRRHPGRFRFLASLPLPDVAAAVAEWRRVRGTPGCVGVIVLSHSAGRYPGDASFEPLWKELDAAGAMVLLHPTSPPHWESVSGGRPRPLIEFSFETARACLDLFEASTVGRHRGIRWVVTHCGGALPIVLDRILTFGLGGLTISPLSTMSQLGRLWFDTAGSPFPTEVPALLQHVGAERMVYGSDYCFTPAVGVAAQLASVATAAAAPSGEPWRRVMARNGRRLLGP